MIVEFIINLIIDLEQFALITKFCDRSSARIPTIPNNTNI